MEARQSSHSTFTNQAGTAMGIFLSPIFLSILLAADGRSKTFLTEKWGTEK
jgi:hypothetical protein